ncbi:FG-GAP-like repeat-containing protein [Allostreptomyces psammosilenae]|uniref:Peptidoglycan recognition protein family domain-containing protein n=1 Tax=Allostreptomyces psammosilenae TaxID=1892865 RepID=A0A853AAQ9_9ACTN|nr:FG-GAP-like repeat-containing protein [Allostreptomyces psammosilenae]NYI07598.1 hypothetical protein [Allostreptomyces psammosilenae]
MFCASVVLAASGALAVVGQEPAAARPATAPGGPAAPAAAATPAAPEVGVLNTLDLLPPQAGGPSAPAEEELPELPATRTEPFRLVAVTWDDPAAPPQAPVQVRTRDAATGTWTPWRELGVSPVAQGADPSESPEGRLRGGTDPLWVDVSDGVQVRLADSTEPEQDGALVVPEGLRVDLIGAEPAAGSTALNSTATGLNSAATSTVAASSVSTAATTVPQPAVISRAGWGATAPTEPSDIGTSIKAVFVHHTAETNDYTCAQSPQIVRDIQTYHMSSLGWRDLGYNFLVDKCGTIFEGRSGGIDQPVIAAHTLGFNTDTTGISVLGEYTSTAPSQAAQDSVAHLAAWKLALYGVDATGQTVLTAGADNGKYTTGQQVTFHNISGHRDGFATECPGTAFYNRLPALRTEARAIQTAPVAPAQPRANDMNGDGIGDLVAIDTSGRLRLYTGYGDGRVSGPVTIGTAGWTGAKISHRGDYTGDGIEDLVARVGTTAYVYPGNGDGTVGSRIVMNGVGSAWANAAQIVSVGDLTGDAYPDVVVEDGGRLLLFAGDPVNKPGVKPGVQIGIGWAPYTIFAPGDTNGDGLPDLLARNTNDGRMWLYNGTISQNFGNGARTLYGSAGWTSSNRPLLASAADADRNGTADIYATTREGTGTLLFYRGGTDANGNPIDGPSTLVGNGGWNGIAFIS